MSTQNQTTGHNPPMENLDAWQCAYSSVFHAIHKRAPESTAGEVLDRRMVFYFQVLAEAGMLQPGRTLVDLGSGVSWFGPMLARLGLRVIEVDDFGGGGGVDLADRDASIRPLEIFRRDFSIEIVEQELLTSPLPLPDASIDVVTCFHVLEHWHHSPRRLLGEVYRVLRPGGYFFVATPNAVNIRKRISVLLGQSNHGALKQWYESEVFRGHVREPVVQELHDLVNWTRLRIAGTYGRNFIGSDTTKLLWLPQPLVKRWVSYSDAVLKYFPTLCSDIHVLAQK